MKKILVPVAAIALLFCVSFLVLYAGKLLSITTIDRMTDYEDGYNLYSINIKYSYDLDKILSGKLESDQDYIDAIVEEVLPLLPVKVEAPQFGCSAFSTETKDGEWLMGRNYDFKRDTSAMLVYNSPKDGYASVSFAALNNIGADEADKSMKTKIACLLSPFAILDGINEKGVSMAVLTLDSEPTRQNEHEVDLPTCLAIRLVLDRAATTEEAIELLGQYDMYASSGRDYHFYITDASGDGAVVEYDPLSETREMVVTRMSAITNFYGMYIDNVLPNQKNDIYGHGKERYDSIMEVLEQNEGEITENTAWEALVASSQLPNSEDVTSNTQWSIVYNNTEKTAKIVLRRNWNDVFTFSVPTS